MEGHLKLHKVYPNSHFNATLEDDGVSNTLSLSDNRFQTCKWKKYQARNIGQGLTDIKNNTITLVL